MFDFYTIDFASGALVVDTDGNQMMFNSFREAFNYGIQLSDDAISDLIIKVKFVDPLTRKVTETRVVGLIKDGQKVYEASGEW